MVRIILTLFLMASCSAQSADESKSKTSYKAQIENRKNISQALSNYVKQNKFPEVVTAKIDSDLDKYKFKYTFDNDMQAEAESLLKRYKPDYGAVFMLDAQTGRVLAMASQEKANPQADNLNLKASFPAASVFKVITATAAIDGAGVEPHDKIAYNGANYTLYKKNVLSDKVNRWTRFITLKDAFARSINTAFGRLTIENLKPSVLEEYADRYMFNSDLKTDFLVQQSQAFVPSEKGFELTKVASGYNRMNTLSPVHGAMIAAAIVNNGQMASPYLVESIKNSDNKTVYTAKTLMNEPVMSKQSAQKLQQLMQQTVVAGTSKTTFKPLVKNKKFRELEFGGKTGHFSGTNPKGTTDWFIGYADDGDQKIAIAAVTVNVKKWTVKSSALAQMMFKKYFKPIVEEKRFAHVQNERKRYSN